MTNKYDKLASAPRQEKPELILNEAVLQFNENGFHDTRLEDIAQKLGAKKNNISYYFANKDLLLKANYERACEFAEREIKAAAQARNGLDRAVCFIRAHLQAHANALNGNGTPVALMADLASVHGEGFKAISMRYETCVAAFRHFLEEGIKDGSVGAKSTDAATFFAFNVMHWIPRWLALVPPNRIDEAIDNFCDLLRFGVATDRTRAFAVPIYRQSNMDAAHLFDRTARNKLKKEAFLRTGIRHLNRSGFRNLSLDQLANELGVTRGAFYYQIEDKDALLAECFERTCSLIETALELGTNAPGLSALDELERSLRFLFEGHITELDPLLRPNLSHLLGAGQRAVFNARLRKITASIAETLARGMVDGSVRPIELDAAETIVFGSVFAASRRRFAATQLEKSWQPDHEPVTASASYIEPLIFGLAAR